MEIINSLCGNKMPRFALFDFDGTISLIREGWQNIMIPMMVETIVATKTNETTVQITDIVSKFVSELTGRQTIYQMIRLEEEVRNVRKKEMRMGHIALYLFTEEFLGVPIFLRKQLAAEQELSAHQINVEEFRRSIIDRAQPFGPSNEASKILWK